MQTTCPPFALVKFLLLCLNREVAGGSLILFGVYDNDSCVDKSVS